jgi:hypothetical protein
MAESDTRLEILEDEVKVLKGEVKRTLVDLRALLMREDSPLGDGALSRRMRPPDRGADSEADHQRRAVPSLGAFSSSPTPAGPGGYPGVPAPAIIIQQGGPPPGPQPSADLAAMAEQERRMAQQERAMAEQERKMTEQERRMTDASRPEQSEPPRHERRHSTEQGQEAGYQLAENTSQVTLSGPEYGEPSQEDGGAAPASGQNGHNSQNGWIDLSEEKPIAGLEENQPGSPERSQRPNRIYDEYRELLEETKEVYPIEDTPAGPPLDINLLSSLVYWVALAKQKVGEHQLQDILELYIKSGHSRPELKDLLLHVSSLVDAAPLSPGQNSGEWVDLMFHLHGILTGGFPVVKIPQMRLAAQADAEPDGG